MARGHYERQSAMDAMFLQIEDAGVHMHIASVGIFEAAPLRRPGGGLNMERLLAFAAAQIHKSPRLRQKLAWIPGFDWPVWVDDDRFNLQYHMRHTALPEPGDARQLKRLAGRILSQSLDRGKPLWEIWLIEGVEPDRVAVLSKLHHCMADGISGGDLIGMLMGTRPDYEPTSPPAWIPRRPPSPAQMAADEIVRRATAPVSLLASALARGPGGRGEEHTDLLGFLRNAARGAWQAAQAGLRPASETPLNVEVGPHRRFDWTRLPLADVKQVGRAAGGKVNDVVLAVVAGAVRSFLERRESGLSGIEFRVAVPVSLRSEGDERPGNRVASLIAPLPIDEADPWQRLERVVETTRQLKRSGETQAVDLMGRVADWLPLGLMASISRAGSRAVNMIVTNVPGSPVPVYMLGARMLETYPVVPLMANEALNVAIFGYDGWLFWGLHADWDAIPDLHEFAESVPAEFAALSAALDARQPAQGVAP